MRETEMEEEEEERPMPASLSSFLWFHLLMLARPPHFSGKLLEGWQGGRGKEGGPFARAGRLAGWLSYAVSKPITRMPSARTGPAAVLAYFSQRSVGGIGCCRGERESGGDLWAASAEERADDEGQMASGGGGGRIP